MNEQNNLKRKLSFGLKKHYAAKYAFDHPLLLKANKRNKKKNRKCTYKDH